MAEVVSSYFKHTICSRCIADLRSTEARGPIPWIATWPSVPIGAHEAYDRFYCYGVPSGQVHDPMPDLADPKEVAAWLTS